MLHANATKNLAKREVALVMGRTFRLPPTTETTTMARGKKNKAAVAEGSEFEAMAAPAPVETVEAKPKKKAKADTAFTMQALSDGYIASLRDAGKSLGTQFSYSIDIAVAVRHFGAETEVSTLTSRKVQNFFESDAVTKTRTGNEKAKPGIDKTRRVLRLALVWAAEQGLIAEAPIPATEKPAAE